MAKKIKAEDLVFHFLNVGFGDTTVIELPPNTNGKRLLGIVDCCDGDKTLEYVKQIKLVRANEGITIDGVEFICATHPHYDHIRGISKKPPVKTGGIALFRLCLSAFGGCFHPPVETSGIEIGRIKKAPQKLRGCKLKLISIFARLYTNAYAHRLPWFLQVR